MKQKNEKETMNLNNYVETKRTGNTPPIENQNRIKFEEAQDNVKKLIENFKAQDNVKKIIEDFKAQQDGKKLHESKLIEDAENEEKIRKNIEAIKNRKETIQTIKKKKETNRTIKQNQESIQEIIKRKEKIETIKNKKIKRSIEEKRYNDEKLALTKIGEHDKRAWYQIFSKIKDWINDRRIEKLKAESEEQHLKNIQEIEMMYTKSVPNTVQQPIRKVKSINTTKELLDTNKEKTIANGDKKRCFTRIGAGALAGLVAIGTAVGMISKNTNAKEGKNFNSIEETNDYTSTKNTNIEDTEKQSEVLDVDVNTDILETSDTTYDLTEPVTEFNYATQNSTEPVQNSTKSSNFRNALQVPKEYTDLTGLDETVCIGDDVELSEGMTFYQSSRHDEQDKKGTIGDDATPAGKFEVTGIATLDDKNNIIEYYVLGADKNEKISISQFARDNMDVKGSTLLHIARITDDGEIQARGWITMEDSIKVCQKIEKQHAKDKENQKEQDRDTSLTAEFEENLEK